MDRLSAMLELHEGRLLKTYKDTLGVTTIGVGHALPDNGAALKAIGRTLTDGDTITNDEADELLAYDIAVAKTSLILHFPPFQALDEVRRAVMVDMCFNVGWPRLAKFVQTLSLIDHARYADASVEMLDSLWARQVGHRAIELSRMMRTGQWV